MTFGWKLDAAARAALLEAFPPVYPRVVADHVTLKPDSLGLPQPVTGEIIGRADDGQGVEALVVRLSGGTERPDGSTWHITWSLAGERDAKESNAVIAALGWTDLPPTPVALIPAAWG